MERQVLLSRWIKPVRIVPDAEVAQMYKDLLDGTGVEVPDNVVPPNLLNELKKAGVPIKESGKVAGDVQFSPRNYDVEVSDTQIAQNMRTVADMRSVITLKGDEVPFGDGHLKRHVLDFFESVGTRCTTKFWGM